MKTKKSQEQKNEAIKDKCGTWLLWSGARFVETENPKPSANTDWSLTCRSNPVTGDFEFI
jgi:hypothetical protein